MTLRDHCTERQLRAHAVLDLVCAGVPVGGHEIAIALSELGEPLNVEPEQQNAASGQTADSGDGRFQ